MLVVDPIEECQGFAVIGVERQHLPQHILHPHQIGEFSVKNRGQAEENVAAHAVIAGPGRRVRHAGDVGFPLVGGAGQAQQLIQSLLGGRILHHRFRPPLERGHLVHKLGLENLRQASQQPLSLLGVGLDAQLDLIDPNQLLPLLAHTVKRLQDLGDFSLHRPVG